MSTVIALLGRRNNPTDGVEDNCTFLAEALGRRGHTLKKVRVNWEERGWGGALLELWRESAEWRGCWVVLQFTSLGWSRRGFPFGALAAMSVVRGRGAHTAVFYHEPRGVAGMRSIDRIRNACQEWVIYRLYSAAERPIFADPLSQISWLPKDNPKAVFIPVGASVHPPPGQFDARKRNAEKKLVVYCVDDPPHRGRQLDDIARAVRLVSSNGWKIRVTFLGRGTEEANDEIQRAFEGLPVEVCNLGLQSEEAVSRCLGGSDAMICVRGKLFPRRSSAIAGIVCGVPMVAYAGACEGTHIAEAGVELVPYRDTDSLGRALTLLLEDETRWMEFRLRSARVYEQHLSWDAISDRFVQAFGLTER